MRPGPATFFLNQRRGFILPMEFSHWKSPKIGPSGEREDMHRPQKF
jgi:hypothetical protein